MTLQYRIRGRTAAEIVAAIEEEVHAGRLPPGASLPTVRELGSALTLSPATVAAAYKALRARGMVAGSGRRGTRVTAGMLSPLARRPATPAVSGLVDLATGNPDPALLPPLQGALRAVVATPHLYGESAELRPLMAFLAAEFDADGVPAAATTLVSGALDGIERVVREHLRPGDAVAVEDPSFPGTLDLLAAAGLRCVPYRIDDEGPVPDAFDDALHRAQAVILTSRAQNPTGAALSAERAAELRRLLRRRDPLTIENDPAGPVAGAPAITLAAATTHWVVVRSTSKFLGPDLRVAALAGDDLTIARVEGRQALGARWVSTILQQLVLSLWSDPSSGRLLARAAEIYAQRRSALLTALAARGVEAHGRSGFNVWIPVRQEGAVVNALAERGWGVMAGERFRLQSAPAVRVTCARLSPADAERLAADVGETLRPAAARFA